MPPLRGPALPPGRLAQLAQPVLDLGGLVLRPWRAADAPAVAAAYAEPGIQRWHMRSMTVTEAGAWISTWPGRWNTETGAGWAVAGADGVVGQISLRRVDLVAGIGELSY